jgi:hypothetical protein
MRWSSQIHASLLGSGVTRVSDRGTLSFGYGAFTLYGLPFQCSSPKRCPSHSSDPTTPTEHCCFAGLGSSRFARRYSGSRYYFPFLGVLRCFSSPGSLYRPYIFRAEYLPMTAGGFPHSDIHGSKPVRRLPVAFRSLLRPSSVLGAKASTVGSL